MKRMLVMLICIAEARDRIIIGRNQGRETFQENYVSKNGRRVTRSKKRETNDRWDRELERSSQRKRGSLQFGFEEITEA